MTDIWEPSQPPSKVARACAIALHILTFIPYGLALVMLLGATCSLAVGLASCFEHGEIGFALMEVAGWVAALLGAFAFAHRVDAALAKLANKIAPRQNKGASKWSLILIGSIGLTIIVGLTLLVACNRGWGSNEKAPPAPQIAKGTLIPGKLCDENRCGRAALVHIDGNLDDLIMTDMLRGLQRLDLKAGDWVCLDSVGGQSSVVYELAYYLHEQNLNTCVAAQTFEDGTLGRSICASACIQLFLSGHQRISAKERLAIHRGHVGTSWTCRQCNLVVPWIGYAVDLVQSHLAYEHIYGDFRRSIYARAMEYGQDSKHAATSAHRVTDAEMIDWQLAKPNSTARFVPDVPMKPVKPLID